MGYTTCLGKPSWPHRETRSCDGCDRCPRCAGFTAVNLWCWKCCGKLTACPECALRLAEHIVKSGPAPEETGIEGVVGNFRFPEALAGYRAALSITRPQTPQDREEVLQRYPILVSHMICRSLGYFSPEAAAAALLGYIKGVPNYCEWYAHVAGQTLDLLAVGRGVVEDSFRFRGNHSGYMVSYQQARLLVEHVRQGGQGPPLGSWF